MGRRRNKNLAVPHRYRQGGIANPTQRVSDYQETLSAMPSITFHIHMNVPQS